METIEAKEVKKMLAQAQEVNVIDVREIEEVVEGVIPGARHIPLGEIENRTNELNRSTAYILVCRSGGRSGKAARILEASGYDATNMNGGMMSWEGPTK